MSEMLWISSNPAPTSGTIRAMNAQEIRKAYLDFYQQKGHEIIPRALLVPQNDPTTLFTGSGMQPMIPYLLGETHPSGRRLANSQVCLRAQDIDDIGDDKHTTSFEMLGNWSLGDYFKTEQIQWMAEFLFDVVGLDPQRVYVSCYIGNEKYGILRDEEAISLWRQEFEKRGIDAKVVALGSTESGDKLGMQGGRIFLYDGKENWWSRNGNEDGTLVGDPCGPDSEMFFDFGEQYHDEAKWGRAHPASDSPRFFEIGNNVFMGYRKTEQGFEPLVAPNIDHGSGLERIAAAAIDSPDVYKISLLKPIIEKLEEISGKSYESHTESMRVITDHLRGATFLAVDGITPSNKEQGYVMRRLMRRAIMKAFNLGIEQNFLEQVVPVIADLYKDDFPEVAAKRDEVIVVLVKEEKVFRQTLRKGLQELTKIAQKSNGIVSGESVFTLYDTYGYPTELTSEVVGTVLENIRLSDDWQAQFNAKMAEQRARSQTAAKGTFKGGLGGQTLQHKKYHTATHLMYQALRDVLGGHVVQRGSNITEERLRFDFNHDDKMTPEQIKQVEDIVNEQIKQDLKISWEEHPTDKAINELHALGQFGDRYGETVKIYRMQADGAEKPYSFEICGGPHVEHTLQLIEDGKTFKITKEESSSAGIRRIKAVLV
ncbi:MAG TPA: alanine--tRNA ligase [Candidatus Limnocylindrales bacterium]|nr:alanine--tRNA ligase [Candidatus Limnocylindrales bacterium]